MAERFGVTREDAPDLRLVKHAHGWVDDIEAFDHCFAPGIDRAVVVKRSAALILPRPCHARDRQSGVHVDSAVALAPEAVAKPEIGSLRRADEAGEGLDLSDGKAGDPRRPFGRAGLQMLFKLPRTIRVFLEVLPVCMPVAEKNMHDRAGQSAVRSGPKAERHVGLPHGSVLINVYGDDLGAALFPGAHRMRHDVDLGADGVGAPDDDAIGLRHLARIRSRQLAGPGNEACPRHVGADRRIEPGVFLRMAQAVDAVAHDEPHRAGVVIRPHGFRAMRALGGDQRLRGAIQRLVPGNLAELLGSLGPCTQKRLSQSLRMMDPLGISRDLRADDAGGVAVVGGAMNPPDGLPVDQFDVERAGGRAIMRTGGVAYFGAEGRVHAVGILTRPSIDVTRARIQDL